MKRMLEGNEFLKDCNQEAPLKHEKVSSDRIELVGKVSSLDRLILLENARSTDI
jgi:hypothetical protein